MLHDLIKTFILKNSQVYSQSATPEESPEWRLAETLGAHCYKKYKGYEDVITHVVSKAGWTEKVLNG